MNTYTLVSEYTCASISVMAIFNCPYWEQNTELLWFRNIYLWYFSEMRMSSLTPHEKNIHTSRSICGSLLRLLRTPLETTFHRGETWCLVKYHEHRTKMKIPVQLTHQLHRIDRFHNNLHDLANYIRWQVRKTEIAFRMRHVMNNDRPTFTTSNTIFLNMSADAGALCS